MNVRYLLLLPLLSLSVFAAEKEFTLTDGRVVRGELLGEQEGQFLLAMKMDQATAKIRLAKDEVVSVKDAPAAVAQPDHPTDAAPRSAVAAPATEGDLAHVRGLLVLARREATTDETPLPRADQGYPYPVWQHWPWIFTINPLGGATGWRYHGHRRHSNPL